MQTLQQSLDWLADYVLDRAPKREHSDSAAIANRPAARDIHQRHYFASLQKALATNFPMTQIGLGAHWPLIAQSFIRARPWKPGNLRGFGAEFPGFISQLQDIEVPPWLIDLAKLEMQRQQTLHSEATVISAFSLPQTDQINRLWARINPHCAQQRLEHRVIESWRAFQDHQHFIEAVREPVLVLSYRQNSAVAHAQFPLIYADLLERLRTQPLIDALGATLEQDPRFNPETALPNLFSSGALTAIYLESPHV